MSMGGKGGSGGSASVPGWQSTQAQDGWKLAQDRFDIQDKVMQQMADFDPWWMNQERAAGDQQQQSQQGMNYSDPFWWDN